MRRAACLVMAVMLHVCSAEASVESITRPPSPWKTNTAPLYPRLATHDQATVILRFVVDDEGAVRNPRIVDGDEPFAKATLEAVKRWRYEPARQAGRAIAVPWEIQVRFELPPSKSDRWGIYRRESH